MIIYTHRGGYPVRRSSPVDSEILRLRRTLVVCGYQIFTIDPSRQQRQRHGNMMVVHKDGFGGAMWIYKRADGRIVVRPWNNKWSFDRMLKLLAEKRQDGFNFVLGGRLEPRTSQETSWKSWLSPASKREAEALGW